MLSFHVLNTLVVYLVLLHPKVTFGYLLATKENHRVFKLLLVLQAN